MTDVRSFLKPERVKRARGRARPDEPLADRCEICGVRRPADRHHKLRRAQGGGDEQANTMDLCGSATTGCHGRVHSNPAWAYELGYLTRSGL